MGFSSEQYKRGSKARPWKVHPVWRGIGCVLFLLVPIMSWYAATLFLETNTKIALPYELTQVVVIPIIHVPAIDKIILQINHSFSASHFMFGQLFLTVIFSFIGFGIIAFIYAILYRIAGPPRYGPFDVPANKVK